MSLPGAREDSRVAKLIWPAHAVCKDIKLSIFTNIMHLQIIFFFNILSTHMRPGKRVMMSPGVFRGRHPCFLGKLENKIEKGLYRVPIAVIGPQPSIVASRGSIKDRKALGCCPYCACVITQVAQLPELMVFTKFVTYLRLLLPRICYYWIDLCRGLLPLLEK